jgi:thiosulfate/3-mercaptopyruvate sulfurtransferase
MTFTTLIHTDELYANLNHPDWVIVDCRFALNDTNTGARAYRQSHIPQARYAHLETDLSGPVIKNITGRHPLPNIRLFAKNWANGV